MTSLSLPATRKHRGVTLTQIKKTIAEAGKPHTVLRPRRENNVAVLDDNGEMVMDVVSIPAPVGSTTRKRARLAKQGFIGVTARSKKLRNRGAACNTKGTKAPKKTWHRVVKSAVETKAAKKGKR